MLGHAARFGLGGRFGTSPSAPTAAVAVRTTVSRPNIFLRRRATPWEAAPAWPVMTAAVDADDHIDAIDRVGHEQGTDNGVAVLVLGKVVFEGRSLTVIWPFPSYRRTRATALLRRPVPR